MKKQKLFRAMNLTDRDEIIELGRQLGDTHAVQTLKKPQKMLVMMKFRESAQNSLFYAGEALACECMVSIGGVKGFAACLGDDTEKAYAMAVIDAVMNADLPEKSLIMESIEKWEKAIEYKQALEAGLTMSTKVNFTIMEEEE
ncbi:MAG: phosphonate C-P lyase system protein PhnG [Oscillospiraceae bacterium]|nr:phosphonate C-P lyase system protein PhnG [Oscillospiraceae bacterium]